MFVLQRTLSFETPQVRTPRLHYPCLLRGPLTKEQLEDLQALPGANAGGAASEATASASAGVVYCTDDVLDIVRGIAPQLELVEHIPRALRALPVYPPPGYAKLYPFQKEDARRLATGDADGLWSAGGLGKCLGRGTRVLRYDGRVAPVEDIAAGDVLMGPDSLPRRVLSTARGVGQLYKIEPVKGTAWVCNDAHVLTLVKTQTRDGDGGKIADVPLSDYLAWPRWQQRNHMQFSVGVDFAQAAELPLDPYFLGLWFGDGSKDLDSVTINKPDLEVRDCCSVVAASYGLEVKNHRSGGSWPAWTLSTGLKSRRHGRNPLLNLMRKLVGPEVTVPPQYLTASRADRLRFLAGWLDSDGYCINGCYEITQKRKDWAEAITFLAQSLGFKVTCRGKIVNGVTYQRMFISGATSEIPLRIPRKRALPRRQKKDPLRTGFSVQPIGEGEYFGFTLDGDGRFLLGDFTVTHNTGTSLVAARALGARRVLVVTRAIGRDSWVRDNVWASGYPVTVLVGEHSQGEPSREVVAQARRSERVLAAAYKAPVSVTPRLAALPATALVVVGWEVLAEAGVKPGRLRADLSGLDWDLAIFDEHHFAKTLTSQRTRAALQIKARVAWGLTATPVPDRARDLWVQLKMLDPLNWGERPYRFFKRYCHAQLNAYGGLDTTGPHLAEEDVCELCRRMAAELHARLERRMVKRTRAAVAHQLPAKTRTILRVPRSAAASAMLDKVVAFDDRRGIEGALAHAADAKRQTIVDSAVESLTGEGKVIVTTGRIAAVAPLARAIQRAIKVRGIRERLASWELTGQIDASTRVDLAREYMRAGGPALIVATHQSIAESMDLQDTDRLIIGQLPVTPREQIQLEARVSRIGQTRPVEVVIPVAEGTIDEPHLALLLEKAEAADRTAGLTDAIKLERDVEEGEILARLNQWLAEENAA